MPSFYTHNSNHFNHAVVVDIAIAISITISPTHSQTYQTHSPTGHCTFVLLYSTNVYIPKNDSVVITNEMIVSARLRSKQLMPRRKKMEYTTTTSGRMNKNYTTRKKNMKSISWLSIEFILGFVGGIDALELGNRRPKIKENSIVIRRIFLLL